MVGVSVRALAESAVRSGYQVIALDAFGDSDLKSFCEGYSLWRDFQAAYSAPRLFKASRQLEFDSVSYTSNLENYPSVVRDFSRDAQILGNSPEVLKHIRNWPELYRTLDRDGFRVPRTVHPADTLPDDYDGQWLEKPLHSGSGRLVSFWKPGQRLKRGYLLQEFIPGLPCSASFIANGHEAVVIGMTEQLIGLPGSHNKKFLYRGNLVPLEDHQRPPDDISILEQVQQIAALLTHEFGLVGFNGFDFILIGGKVCVIEVNPRYGASMEVIERAYNLPVFDLHYKAVTLGTLPDFDLKNTGKPADHFIVKTILYADRDGVAPDTSNWLSGGVRDIPHPGESLKKGQPVCTLFAEGNSRSECLTNLNEVAERYKKEIYG